MGAPIKILTIGPPAGALTAMVAKVTPIEAKHGPFAALFVLGDLFKPRDSEEGEQPLTKEEKDLLSGQLKLPLPTYIIHPPSLLPPQIIQLFSSAPLESNGARRIAPNLFYLGQSGVTRVGGTQETGLNVAFCGGGWNATAWSKDTESNADEDPSKAHISPASVKKLMSHAAFVQGTTPKVNLVAASREPQTLAAARAAAAVQASAASEAAAAQALAASVPPIDLFLTNAWPSGVTLFADPNALPHASSRTWGAPTLASLARASKARYHFSLAPGPESEGQDGIVLLEATTRARGTFWERAPFRTLGSAHAACSATRFVSLARFGNTQKQRWFMALNLVPASCMDEAQRKAAAAVAPNVTPNPFSTPNQAPTKREGEDLNMVLSSGDNFRWAGQPTHGKSKRIKREPATGSNTGALGLPSKPDVPMPSHVRNRTAVLPVGPQDCWFCLSNAECAKHLIVAIGEECYVALPKGQLPSSSDPLSTVPGGGHVLVIPLEHTPSLLTLSPSQGGALKAEMDRWRAALRQTYATFAAVSVSWEICRLHGTRAGHMQIQVVPVPAHLAGGLEKCFREAAKTEGYDFLPEHEVQAALELREGETEEQRRERGDYFRLDLPEKTLFMRLYKEKFYLQFPRQTLATYLNLPDRADWRVCARSEAVERAEASAFGEAFAEEAAKVTGEAE